MLFWPYIQSLSVQNDIDFNFMVYVCVLFQTEITFSKFLLLVWKHHLNMHVILSTCPVSEIAILGKNKHFKVECMFIHIIDLISINMV